MAELPLGTHLDLNRLREDQRLNATIATETPEERTTRLRLKQWEALVDHGIRIVTFVAVLIGVIGAAYFSVTLMLSPTASSEQKSWAQSTLSAIISGSVLFVTGRATARRKDE